jgi:hypothetical protein
VDGRPLHHLGSILLHGLIPATRVRFSLFVHCDGAVRRDRGYRVCLYASAMSGDHRALGLRSG